jgi:hypothetical protein
VRCCKRDEGRSFEAAMQVEASNTLTVRSSLSILAKKIFELKRKLMLKS